MAQNSGTHQKTNKVPEEEGSADERLSANGSQERTLSKSRENEALMESQAVPAWAKIHTLSSPPLLLVFSPSLSRTLKLSRSEKLHGWPPSLTELMPQNLCPFHRSSQKPQKIAGEGRAWALFQIALPVPQHSFLNAFEGLWENPTCIPQFCPDPGQERCGV